MVNPGKTQGTRFVKLGHVVTSIDLSAEPLASSRSAQGALPLSAWIGVVASSCAIVLWTLQQLSGHPAFAFLTLPFKLALFAVVPFFYRDLSALLFQRRRAALVLLAAVVTVTTLGAAAYLPWRDSFAVEFNNDSYRWYHNHARQEYELPGLEAWRTQWEQRLPHLKETCLLVAYYSAIIGICTSCRLQRRGSFLLALAGYAFLAILPNVIGLLKWDYDLFLGGIIFDSISVDLFPLAFWFAGDHSIFFYSFMFIFFAVCWVFFSILNSLGKRRERPLEKEIPINSE